LRRRGFALHEGFEPKTLESLRETLGACGLLGEFIHGAIAILFYSAAFAWRRAHLERRAHLISFRCSPGEEYLSDLVEV
jgi:hypothetical protein